MAQARDHPSLWRPGMFAITWQFATWVGGGLVVLSALSLDRADYEAMGTPLAMIAAVIVLSELRPIVMSRLDGNPVSISLAFVFAALYVWGLYPAVMLMTLSVVMSELLQRKPLWKLLFNVGQYNLSVAAAWCVLALAGVTATPQNPLSGLSARDLGWLLGSWVVYHLVNLAMVSGLAGSDNQTWWDCFTEDFWFYTVSVAAVLALSPIVAIVLMAGSSAWALIPLLLLPLLAVQRAAQMSRENEHQAMHDPLTGLPNRALLSDRIQQALARGSRLPGRVTVLFLDVDLFKVVNDSLGHAAGDRLLREVAQRLTFILRAGDTLARFGGDEFVIVCEEFDQEEIPGLVDRVTSVLADPFEFEGRSVIVTASIGIAIASLTTDAETLLRDADAAMYRAKGAGRNQAVVFDEGMHEQAAARLEAEFGLRQALEHGQLRVYYQPVLTLDTQVVVGFEALVRWKHPSLGLLPPDQFVAVAEETGLIVPLGEWVLQQALDQVAGWRARLPGASDLWVSVNLSARQLRARNVVDMVADALLTSGMPPTALRLEITESVVMDEVGPTIDAMKAIRALGVHLAIDDFGTGYSSLSYLKSLPVSTIKIDRTFVDCLGSEDAAAAPLVDAIVSMARALDLEVIAEGVETAVQRRTLIELGAGLAQGYFWSRPLEPGLIPAWVAARSRISSSA